MTAVGGSANSAVDAAVNNAISKGIHFVVTAGNSNTDASTTTPARVAAAITVGAVDASGRRSSFSNYGTVVDVYYYGTALSAWIGSTTATATLSGTRVAM
jgi:cerevisin